MGLAPPPLISDRSSLEQHELRMETIEPPSKPYQTHCRAGSFAR